MTHDERCQTVLQLGPNKAAKMVYQWVKTGVIDFQEFAALYPLIDLKCECEDCGGVHGGVPGNENIVDGRVLCDYCTTSRIRT